MADTKTQTTEPLAVWALVLSVMGWGCWGPVAIAGVICGRRALLKIGAQPELGGRGLAVAGVIIGYCALAASVYAVAAWLLIQILTQLLPYFEIPTWSVRLVIVLLVLGFPVAVALGWVHARRVCRKIEAAAHQ
jgi:hypothetical protein